MRDFLGEYKKLVVFAAIGVGIVLVLYFVLRPEPLVRGERDAREDLAHGHYVQLGYGLPTEWASEYDQCLRQRCGVEVRNIGGDVLTESELSYYQSYNSVSTAAIKQKFGPDVFDQCVDAARKSWGSSHPKAQRN
jgi:hypothetical protein